MEKTLHIGGMLEERNNTITFNVHYILEVCKTFRVSLWNGDGYKAKLFHNT